MNLKAILFTLSFWTIPTLHAFISITPYDHHMDETDLKKILKEQIPQDYNESEVNSGIKEVEKHMIAKEDEYLHLAMIKVNNKNAGYICAALPPTSGPKDDALVFAYSLPQTHHEEVLQRFTTYVRKNSTAHGVVWPNYGIIPEDIFQKCGFQLQSNVLFSYFTLHFNDLL